LRTLSEAAHSGQLPAQEQLFQCGPEVSNPCRAGQYIAPPSALLGVIYCPGHLGEEILCMMVVKSQMFSQSLPFVEEHMLLGLKLAANIWSLYPRTISRIVLAFISDRSVCEVSIHAPSIFK